jgi:hypothetical protein
MQCVYCEVRTIWKNVQASHRGGVASVPGQSMCDLWWQLHRARFVMEPVNSIPQMFHSHLRLHVGLTRKTNEQRLGTVTKQCCFRNRGALGCRVPFQMWPAGWRGGEGMAEAVSRQIWSVAACVESGPVYVRFRVVRAALEQVSVYISVFYTSFLFHRCFHTFSILPLLFAAAPSNTTDAHRETGVRKKKKLRFLPWKVFTLSETVRCVCVCVCVCVCEPGIT